MSSLVLRISFEFPSPQKLRLNNTARNMVTKNKLKYRPPLVFAILLVPCSELKRKHHAVLKSVPLVRKGFRGKSAVFTGRCVLLTLLLTGVETIVIHCFHHFVFALFLLLRAQVRLCSP